MNRKPSDVDQLWQGPEPEQPRRGRGPMLVALVAALCLLLGICALTYYTLRRQAPAPEQALVAPPTEIMAEPVEASVTAETNNTPVESIAPTATLSGSLAALTPPPLSAETIASRRNEPALIDADAADWAGYPPYVSPYLVYNTSDWDGSDDLTAVWQVSWDDLYLYFLFDVADNTHAQNQTGNQVFRGDSIDLQLDTDRAGDLGASLSPDDIQISLSPGDFSELPPSAFRFQGMADGTMRDAPGGHDIVVAARPTSAGYVLEAAIPWRDLGLVPNRGLVIGLAVNFNDNDRIGEGVQEVMKSNAPNRRFGDPTTWGTLSLD